MSRLFALCLALLFPVLAAAQGFPSKALRIVVPFTPAGAVDIATRATAHEMSRILGQPVAVENKPGAGGNLGVLDVARSAPDGYSMVMSTSGIQAINPALYAKMPLDPNKELIPVAPLVSLSNVLVVHPSVPARSVKDIIALAKKDPGKWTYASSGNGTSIHMSGAMFTQLTGTDIVHIPYKGSAPAVTDLLAGQTNMMFDNIPSSLPHIKSGRLIALATTGAKRDPALPDVPTIAESGVRGYESGVWFGLMAPAGTPRDVILKLNAAAVQATKSPEFIKRMTDLGYNIIPGTPEDMGAAIKAELARWAPIVKASGREGRLMAKAHRIEGVLSPVVTPFGKNYAPDAERFVRHCRWLLKSGCAGLAVFGTNSEANSMSVGEKRRLLEALVAGGVPAAALMPGTGHSALSDSIEMTKAAVELGCAGVLMLPPFYYKGVPDEGLYRNFAEVIERVGDDRLQLYLYHIPPVSQVAISLELIDRLLSKYPGIVAGVKDSSGDWKNTKAMLDAFSKRNFDVFAGSEVFLLDNMRNGGKGCITATGNINPGPIDNVFRNWRSAEADKLQAGITATRQIVQKQPMIPALKNAIAHFGNDPQWKTCRPPLIELNASQEETLIKELRANGFSMPGLTA